MLTIAITGANSFIGKHLVEFLLSAREDFRLRLLTRSQTSAHHSSRITTVIGDMLSTESVRNLVEGAEAVVNLAYLWERRYDDNRAAIENLLGAVNDCGIRRLIHCSTAIVVGRSNEHVITESAVCRPRTEYERIKFQLEQLLLAGTNDRCETVIVRPTAVFGPGGKNLFKVIQDIQADSAVASFVRCSLQGCRNLNLVSVHNVVGAISFLLEYPRQLIDETFIVSDDHAKENNYQDVAERISQQLGTSSRCRGLNLPPFVLKGLLMIAGRTFINPMQVFSSQKLRNLGYSPRVEFEQALDEFVNWFISLDFR